MTNTDLLNRLVYLDRDFIAGAYEATFDEAPITQITKNEGLKAGAQVPFFSAGLSAAESRTYSTSTFGMLIKLLPELERIPAMPHPPIEKRAASSTCWVEGSLVIYKVVVKSSSKRHDQLPSGPPSAYDQEKASETYFAIQAPNGVKLALITTPDYFSSGLDALTKLWGTVLDEVSIPVKALVRVYSANSTFNEWLAVPLFIKEHG